MTTREELSEALAKICWSMKGKYPNEYIFDQEGKRTCYRVLSDRIEVSGVNENSAVCFHYKGSDVKLLEEGDAVSLGTEQCFVLFINHNVKKVTPTT